MPARSSPTTTRPLPRTLAADKQLAVTLHITDAEWHALASIHPPSEICKEGYVQLLFSVRAVTTA